MAAVAVPASVSVENLTGKWALDKSRTTGVTETLELQNISWLLRKVIAGASPTTTIVHEGLDFTMSTVAPGVPVTSTEERHMDWTERLNKMAIFGTVTGATRLIQLQQGQTRVEPYELHKNVPILEDEADREWLAADWITEDDGTVKLVEMQGKNADDIWISRQIWGFILVDGKRTHVRKLITWTKDKKVRTAMYYHYLGPPT